ncbi:superoxide dismutase 1 copper chaperone (heavy-metal-associated domain-containing protein) [Colletotrichum sojae]|uniref:Superoxide dismutase 1 copper chaperone n=1 Tax=Colletotrichum sojae TaxID=2175907 RepID=A0A8H6MYD9_9PEZI|nr:superoxide dismutase 1 copper chaperone (heavy-metal-associated domain-containing protein) [Colletotrichum sojae]
MLYCLDDFLHNYRSLLRIPNRPSTIRPRPFTMTVSYPFQTVFAVPMTCDSCVKDVSDSLYKLGGITKVEANLKDQLLSIEGTAAPSAIVDAIQATGRDAILRGSGASNSAAVSILESFYQVDASSKLSDEERSREVRGLARIVQVSPTTSLIDLTLRGVAPGSYRATIREYGNLEHGAASTGPVWSGASGEDADAKGFLGVFDVGQDGRGSAYLDRPFQIWEVIGHAMVVSRQQEYAGATLKNDPDTLVGVIARSAGVWDNDKTVCSCTGKTLWEERKDEVNKGML